MPCNDKNSFAADKCVAYIEGFNIDVAFYLKVGGGNIITCSLKTRNSVAAKTVPATVVPRMFIQEPVFLALTI